MVIFEGQILHFLHHYRETLVVNFYGIFMRSSLPLYHCILL